MIIYIQEGFLLSITRALRVNSFLRHVMRFLKRVRELNKKSSPHLPSIVTFAQIPRKPSVNVATL